MAEDLTISGMPLRDAIDGTEEIPVASGGENYKIKAAQLTGALPKTWAATVAMTEDLFSMPVTGPFADALKAGEVKAGDFIDIGLEFEGEIADSGTLLVTSAKGDSALSCYYQYFEGDSLTFIISFASTPEGVFMGLSNEIAELRNTINTANTDLTNKINAISTDLTNKINAISTDIKVVEQTAATATIQPNVLNKWGEVATLTVDFAAPKEGIVNEYMLEFTSGATATSLSLPADVKFPDELTIEANMRYQVSVVDNIGLIAEVEA